MGGRFLRISAGLTLFLSVVLAAYIMVNHMGLVDGLDFGAGAYYYADIPEFDRYVRYDVYDSPVSMWTLMVIFLIWGAAMYRLWVYIDSRKEEQQ